MDKAPRKKIIASWVASIILPLIIYYAISSSYSTFFSYVGYFINIDSNKVLITERGVFFSFLMPLSLIPLLILALYQAICRKELPQNWDRLLSKFFGYLFIGAFALQLVLSISLDTWIENNGYQYCRALSSPSALPGTKSTYVLDMADCKAE